MESSEQYVALAIVDEGFVVSEAVKFPVRRKTNKDSRDEFKTHGYEVDLVGARKGGLVLATVKSFFGSKGVPATNITGEGTQHFPNGYPLLNTPEVTTMKVLSAAGMPTNVGPPMSAHQP